MACCPASLKPSMAHVALATHLTYRRDESEKIFQRIPIGDCSADHDRLWPSIWARPSAVQTALEGVLPEPIHEHYVVIYGRRWPPKQVLALVTGLDRADFTTHQARRALTRLGFPAARAASSRETLHVGRSGDRGIGTCSPGHHPADDPGRGPAPVHRPVGRRARGRGTCRCALA